MVGGCLLPCNIGCPWVRFWVLASTCHPRKLGKILLTSGEWIRIGTQKRGNKMWLPRRVFSLYNMFNTSASLSHLCPQRSPLKSKENTPGVSSEDCCGDSLANFPGNGSRGTGHGAQKTQRQTKIDKIYVYVINLLSICWQFCASSILWPTFYLQICQSKVWYFRFQ